jgi:hypothetical protein
MTARLRTGRIATLHACLQAAWVSVRSCHSSPIDQPSDPKTDLRTASAVRRDLDPDTRVADISALTRFSPDAKHCLARAECRQVHRSSFVRGWRTPRQSSRKLLFLIAPKSRQQSQRRKVYVHRLSISVIRPSHDPKTNILQIPDSCVTRLRKSPRTLPS